MEKEEKTISLQICWILDITGSMSTQIAACKTASAMTAEQVKADDLPVGFSVITYTESGQGAWASYNSFEEADPAVAFINNITLCRPPEDPKINASGGDGDENLKQALAKFHKNHDFDIPTVCFMLTDACYHPLTSRKSTEAKHEEAALREMGYPVDILQIWEKIPQNQVFMFPILFGSLHHAYGQFAKQTGGFVMKPSSGTSANIISDAMVSIVKNILNRLTGESEEELSTIEKFNIYDASDLKVRTSEKDEEVGALKVAANQESILKSAMTRIVEIVGKGWGKRKINMNAKSLFYQMRLVAYCVKYFSGDESLKAEIESTLELIDENLPEEQKQHIRVKMATIEHLKSQAQFSALPDNARDMITLLTVKEFVEETGLNEIRGDFIATVCSVIYGLPATIKYQIDSAGNQDFSSSWDSVVSYLGIDIESLKSFLTALNFNDGKKQTGLTGGKDCNSFVITCGKPGSLRWLIFKLASGLQVLDSAMSLGVGASITEAIPNLHAGMVAQSVMTLIRAKLTPSIFKRLAELLETIKAMAKTPGGEVREYFKLGQANPEDAISKLILVAYKTRQNDEIFIHIFREFLASAVQRQYGKRDAETTELYHKEMSKVFPLDQVFGDFDDKNLKEIHPLENNSFTEETLLKIIAEEADEKNEAAEAALEKIRAFLSDASFLEKLCAENEIYQRFLENATNLWTVLNADTTSEEVPELVDLEEVYPSIKVDFLQSLLLRKRKERYNLIHNADEDKNVHMLKEATPMEVLIFRLLKNTHEEKVKERAKRIAKICKQKLVQNILKKFEKEPGLTAEQWVEFLKENTVEFNTITYRLTRQCIAKRPSKFFQAGQNALMKAVLLLDWTSDIPQTLKAMAEPIRAGLTGMGMPEAEIEEILEIVDSQEMANRDTKNRHGHCLTFQYPGPVKWTQAYQDEAQKNDHAEAMKQFTRIYNEFLEDSRLDTAFVRRLAARYNCGHFWNVFEAAVKVCHPEVYNVKDLMVDINSGGGVQARKSIWDVKRGFLRRWRRKYLADEFKEKLDAFNPM